MGTENGEPARDFGNPFPRRWGTRSLHITALAQARTGDSEYRARYLENQKPQQPGSTTDAQEARMSGENLTPDQVSDITGFVDIEARPPEGKPTAHFLFGTAQVQPVDIAAERYHQGLAP
ncbi:hypothetical protein NKH77_49045 [Streptomyces sp. M19]